MPRPKKTARSRDYDPTPTEEWWLFGKPFPPMVPRGIQRELGGDSRLDECIMQGLNPLAVLALNNPEGVLDRLRKLFEAAPESIRRRVPPVRRKIIEGEWPPDADLLREDEQRTEKLQRETPWKSEWLNRWCRMTKAERDEVVKRVVRRKADPMKE